MKKVVIAIVVALVLAGVGVTLFFMLRGGDEEKPTDRVDRADIADITDLSGIADKVDIDDLTSIINSETRDNAKEKSQTDVIVTVNDGTELNLTGDVGEVIRKVSDDNGVVIDLTRYHSLFYDKKTNNIYTKNVNHEFMNNKDYWLGISPYKISSLSYGSSCPGEIRYEFDKNKSDEERLIIDRISLFDGWDGDKSDIGNYLDEKNSVIYPVEDSERVNCRLALFKNGELVPVNEIIDKYGKEAEQIIFDYYGSLSRYYQETQNWDKDKVYEYWCGTVGRWNGSYYLPSGRNSMAQVLESEDPDYIYSQEAPTYPALHLEICLQLAMNEWATIDDGSIKNYGCINWTPGQSTELSISVHCTHEDFLRILDPYVENNDGELIPPRRLQ